MNDKVSPVVEIFRDHLPWVYAFALSMWGGLVQYAQRVRMGERWSLRDLVLDMVVCSFAGLLAFFVCQHFGVTDWQMAIVVSVSAHSGARAIAQITMLSDKVLGGGK